MTDTPRTFTSAQDGSGHGLAVHPTTPAPDQLETQDAYITDTLRSITYEGRLQMPRRTADGRFAYVDPGPGPFKGRVLLAWRYVEMNKVESILRDWPSSLETIPLESDYYKDMLENGQLSTVLQEMLKLYEKGFNAAVETLRQKAEAVVEEKRVAAEKQRMNHKLWLELEAFRRLANELTLHEGRSWDTQLTTRQNELFEEFVVEDACGPNVFVR